MTTDESHASTCYPAGLQIESLHMRTDTGVTIFRSAYRAPDFWIDRVHLQVDLDASETIVEATLYVRRDANATGNALVLVGEELTLLQVSVDGRALDPTEYTASESLLTIHQCPANATVKTRVQIDPSSNTQLMGLYVSSGSFFTQCEAEGFRRITYFLDRPDVMARYTVEIHADKAMFPYLLSNGNLIEQSDLPNGKHRALWEDPFPKPSYLFALVAGQFAVLEERIKTASGKPALLQIYVEPEDFQRTQFAMDSLIESIRWDEQRFGLELDLERFMIVAVRDFNMGAMENKGLNIFNSAYVLASPETATDQDYSYIESIVGHEYFHNWTGNRVTCRDWFQLTLKEGLTVFRDQEFSADMMAAGLDAKAAASARAVKRIEDVRDLRAYQFPEDSGPMAHPVRPESYQEIGNFYTPTVYKKGAEVIRMQQTLLGRDGFEAGMKEYFKRHDGQAVTCDDFINAMESVYVARNPGRNLQQLRLWYSLAGTPKVTVTTKYDHAAKTYSITLTQSCPKIGVEAGVTDFVKQPYHIPFAVGLIGADGSDLTLKVQGEPSVGPDTTRLLHLTGAEQTWVFEDVEHEPVPSLLRNFSAPVSVHYGWTDAQLLHVLAHDSDAFSRWEAAQTLATERVLSLAIKGGFDSVSLDTAYVSAVRSVLMNESLDASYRSLVLALPGEVILGQMLYARTGEVNPVAIHQAREAVRGALANTLKYEWRAAYEQRATDYKTVPFSTDRAHVSRRALQNLALAMWTTTGDPSAIDASKSQYALAHNMTDQFAALACIVNAPRDGSSHLAPTTLTDFYNRWQANPTVIDKWFALQAASRYASTESLRKLMQRSDFTLSNPNRVRAAAFQFISQNPGRFHAEGEVAYAMWADLVIKVDSMNAELAARLARSLERWRSVPKAWQPLIEAQLKRIQATAGLSSNTAEIVGKALE